MDPVERRDPMARAEQPVRMVLQAPQVPTARVGLLAPTVLAVQLGRTAPVERPVRMGQAVRLGLMDRVELRGLTAPQARRDRKVPVEQPGLMAPVSCRAQ